MYRSPDWGDSLLIFTKSERWILLECNKLAWNICSKYVKVMIHLVQHKVELCHMITPGLFDVFTMNSCVTSWRNKKGCVSMMVVVPLLPQCCMAHGKTHPTLCLKKNVFEHSFGTRGANNIAFAKMIDSVNFLMKFYDFFSEGLDSLNRCVGWSPCVFLTLFHSQFGKGERALAETQMVNRFSLSS